MKADEQTANATMAVRYVPFLRGINMIGHKLIPMPTLAELFSSLGFRQVKTYLATGNVLFESEESDMTKLTSQIEKELQRLLGYEVSVLLRTIPELEELIKLAPFDGQTVDNQKTRAFVTFLSKLPQPKIELPFLPPNKEFMIVGTGPREVFSLRYALGNGRYGDSVSFIEKEFGLPATSRNYNTFVKILRLK